MTPEQQALIRSTWARLRPEAEGFGARFYRRLFELSPESLRLFRQTDLPAQQAKFIAMLDDIVRLVADSPALVHVAAELGRRHGGYGVRDEHYPMVTTALLLALSEELGADWTPDVRESWRDGLALVTALMRRGAG